MIFTYISMSVSQLYYLFYVDMDMMGLCWAPDDDSFLAFNLRTKVENHKLRHSLIYTTKTLVMFYGKNNFCDFPFPNLLIPFLTFRPLSSSLLFCSFVFSIFM